MELVNKKYYDGFEGEPEIQFIYKKGNDTEILVIWEGYFDQIMRLVLPDDLKQQRKLCHTIADVYYYQKIYN